MDTLKKALTELEALCADLETKQTEYNILMNAAQKALDKYNAQNKAFLDEQAGVLASKLAVGDPCPVCGSTHHPILAIVSEDAPTEADLKAAKKKYEGDQKKPEEKSGECGTLKGQIEASTKNIKEQIIELLGDCEIEKASSVIEEKSSAIQDALVTLDEKIKMESDKIQEKKKLEVELPNQEKLLETLRENLTQYTNAYTTSLATKQAKEEQLSAFRKDLRFPSKADAQKELQTLSTQKEALQKALNDATEAFNNSDKVLYELRGELSALERVVEQVCKINLEAETQKREDLNIKAEAHKFRVSPRINDYEQIEQIKKLFY